VLSIAKTVHQLDKLEGMHRAAMESYGEVLRAAAEYPVEMDAMEAQMYRQHIQRLRQMLENVLGVEDFQTIHTSFRGELRDYRDKVNEWLDRMRTELKAALEAMQTLSGRVSASGGDHEAHLREDLNKLKEVAQTSDLGRIRVVIQEVAGNIAESAEQMSQANKFTIAQLRDEIQSLHREMESTRRTLYTDRATGAWNRAKMESRLDEFLHRGEAFVAIILWVSNLKRLEADSSEALIDGALKAMVQRVAAMFDSPATLGRWTHDQFVLLLDVNPAAAAAISSDLARKLSVRYAVQQDGLSHNVSLRVASAVLQHSADGEPREFLNKMEQMTGGLPLQGDYS
jgi:GGDEF domain-containing protein